MRHKESRASPKAARLSLFSRTVRHLGLAGDRTLAGSITSTVLGRETGIERLDLHVKVLTVQTNRHAIDVFDVFDALLLGLRQVRADWHTVDMLDELNVAVCNERWLRTDRYAVNVLDETRILVQGGRNGCTGDGRDQQE